MWLDGSTQSNLLLFPPLSPSSAIKAFEKAPGQSPAARPHAVDHSGNSARTRTSPLSPGVDGALNPPGLVRDRDILDKDSWQSPDRHLEA